MKFHHFWTPPGKIVLDTLWRIYYCPSQKKILPTLKVGSVFKILRSFRPAHICF